MKLINKIFGAGFLLLLIILAFLYGIMVGHDSYIEETALKVIEIKTWAWCEANSEICLINCEKEAIQRQFGVSEDLNI